MRYTKKSARKCHPLDDHDGEKESVWADSRAGRVQWEKGCVPRVESLSPQTWGVVGEIESQGARVQKSLRCFDKLIPDLL